MNFQHIFLYVYLLYSKITVVEMGKTSLGDRTQTLQLQSMVFSTDLQLYKSMISRTPTGVTDQGASIPSKCNMHFHHARQHSGMMNVHVAFRRNAGTSVNNSSRSS